MMDPATAMNGFSYERSAITTWFQRHNTSPMTRAELPHTLVPNIGIRSTGAELSAAMARAEAPASLSAPRGFA